MIDALLYIVLGSSLISVGLAAYLRWRGERLRTAELSRYGPDEIALVERAFYVLNSAIGCTVAGRASRSTILGLAQKNNLSIFRDRKNEALLYKFGCKKDPYDCPIVFENDRITGWKSYNFEPSQERSHDSKGMPIEKAA